MARSQPQPQLYDDISEWPIYRLHSERATFVQEIQTATLNSFFDRYTLEELEQLLEKTSYKERIRIKEDPWRVDPPDDRNFWRKIRSELGEIAIQQDDRQKEAHIRQLYERIIVRYSEEIVGTFNKKTFKFARKFLTALFKWLLNAVADRKGIPFWGNRRQLYEKLIIHGPIEDIRQLSKNHILVVVPTHFSNLDSILVGYAMDSILGLPSFFYGAGLNLYNFGPAAYFMNRLGAYRLDRRKRNPIYLETLKTMSRIAMEKGTNTLFFPGGTRSRSGRIEEKLKLGLLGTALEAQQALYQKESNQKIVIVPLVISYHFVLEAKYLVEQYLKRTGREQYLRTRDQSSSIRKWLRFFWQLFSATSDITLSFGKPMDVLGNFLDQDGLSYSNQGEVVRLQEYFQTSGLIKADKQRESEYTRMLAEKILVRYHRENTVLSSHLVAFAAFKLLCAQNPNLDLFAVLRLPEEEFSVPFSQFCRVAAAYQLQLLEMEREGLLLLSKNMHKPIETLVKIGIKKLGSYHGVNPLKWRKRDQMIISKDFNLLYYYHNRLNGFGLDERVDIEKHAPSAFTYPFTDD